MKFVKLTGTVGEGESCYRYVNMANVIYMERSIADTMTCVFFVGDHNPLWVRETVEYIIRETLA